MLPPISTVFISLGLPATSDVEDILPINGAASVFVSSSTCPAAVLPAPISPPVKGSPPLIADPIAPVPAPVTIGFTY